MMNMNRGNRAPWVKQYKALPAVYEGKEALVDHGGKIILPNSAMEELAQRDVVYPMMFSIKSKAKIVTHCGVLEFSAEEGRVLLPYWMMNHLRCGEGEIITITNVSVPKGVFVKLRPQTKNFVEDISNPRAVLERKLNHFTCMTVGDTFVINYNDVDYCVDVTEVKSQLGETNAILVVETDLNVDFDRPADMPPSPVHKPAPKAGFASAGFGFKSDTGDSKDEKPKEDKQKEEEKPAEPTFKAFSGQGRSLSGKVSGGPPPSSSAPKPAEKPAAPSGGRTLGGGRKLGS